MEPHFELLPPAAAWHLIGSVALWLVFVALWMRGCVWVDGDARVTFGSNMPWSLLLAVCGSWLVVAPLLLGLTAYRGLLLAPVLIGAVYVWRRDTRLAPEERAVVSPRIQQAVWACVRRLPVVPGLERAEAVMRSELEEPLVRVTFRDPNGVSRTTLHGGRQQRTIDRAIHATRGLFKEAFACQAGAVHFEPRPDGRFRILYKIDGVLRQRKALPPAPGAALMAALKSLAGADGRDVLPPHVGTFTVSYGTDQRDFVASTHRHAFGERLELQAIGEPLAGGLHRDGLAAIGLPGPHCDSLRQILKQQHGLLLIAGPRQSGKTTTGYAAISEISPLERSVATAELFIQEHRPFAMQASASSRPDLTLPGLLREIMQHAADVVYVDEIADRETAEIAMGAAMERLIVATIQAEDAASALTHLLRLGVDPTFVQQTVTAALSQRLARKLCMLCKQPYPPPLSFRRKLRYPESGTMTVYKRKRKGCEACHGTGYSGLVPITEFLPMNDGIRQMLFNWPTSRLIRARARRAGMLTLREAAIALVQNGTTSIREVVRVVP